MANWAALRGMLNELEAAIEGGDVPQQLRAGGRVAHLVGDVVSQPRAATDGTRFGGDLQAGDCYRTCDRILELARARSAAVQVGGVEFNPEWIVLLLQFLRELLKR